MDILCMGCVPDGKFTRGYILWAKNFILRNINLITMLNRYQKRISSHVFLQTSLRLSHLCHLRSNPKGPLGSAIQGFPLIFLIQGYNRRLSSGKERDNGFHPICNIHWYPK